MPIDRAGGKDPDRTSASEGASSIHDKTDGKAPVDDPSGDENVRYVEQASGKDEVGPLPGPTSAEFREIVDQYDDLSMDRVGDDYPSDENPQVAEEVGRGDLSSDWTPGLVSEIPLSTGCEEVARQIQERIGGKIHRIESPVFGGFLGRYRDEMTEWGYHDVVFREGRVYDYFTERTGLPTDEYKSLWSDMHPDEFPF